MAKKKKQTKKVLGERFNPDKVIREIYTGFDTPPEIVEIPITSDNRFVLHGLDISLSDKEKQFEVIINLDPAYIKVGDEYYYVPEGRFERLRQAEIDTYLFRKIVVTNLQDLEELLDYQLSKYPQKRKRLKDLKVLFEDEYNFRYNDGTIATDKQQRCLIWVEDCLKGDKLKPTKKKPTSFKEYSVNSHTFPMMR